MDIGDQDLTTSKTALLSKTEKGPKQIVIVDMISNNFAWILLVIISIAGVLLLILAFIEFGQEDEKEGPIKGIFIGIFVITIFLVCGVVGIHLFKKFSK